MGCWPTEMSPCRGLSRSMITINAAEIANVNTSVAKTWRRPPRPKVYPTESAANKARTQFTETTVLGT